MSESANLDMSESSCPFKPGDVVRRKAWGSGKRDGRGEPAGPPDVVVTAGMYLTLRDWPGVCSYWEIWEACPDDDDEKSFTE